MEVDSFVEDDDRQLFCSSVEHCHTWPSGGVSGETFVKQGKSTTFEASINIQTLFFQVQLRPINLIARSSKRWRSASVAVRSRQYISVHLLHINIAITALNQVNIILSVI